MSTVLQYTAARYRHPRPDPVSGAHGAVTMSKRLLRAVPTAVYKTQGVYWMGDSLFLRVTSIRKSLLTVYALGMIVDGAD